MSREQVKIAGRLANLVNRRDFDGLADLLHPRVEFHSVIGAVEGKVYLGIDGLREFVRDMDATWDGYRIQQEELHEAGDQAVIVVRAFGVARASGIPLDQRLGLVLTWRDGTVWRIAAYSDPKEARSAVGLRE